MSKRNIRKESGQSSLELILGFVAIVPLIMLFVDIGLVVVAANANDSICRQAARAAASAPPAHSRERAGQVVAVSRRDTSSMTISLSDVQVNGRIPDTTTGGIVDGTVSVTTRATVGPLALLSAIRFGEPVYLDSVQTFPYTCVISPNMRERH